MKKLDEKKNFLCQMASIEKEWQSVGARRVRRVRRQAGQGSLRAAGKQPTTQPQRVRCSGLKTFLAEICTVENCSRCRISLRTAASVWGQVWAQAGAGAGLVILLWVICWSHLTRTHAVDGLAASGRERWLAELKGTQIPRWVSLLLLEVAPARGVEGWMERSSWSILPGSHAFLGARLILAVNSTRPGGLSRVKKEGSIQTGAGIYCGAVICAAVTVTVNWCESTAYVCPIT